MNDYERAQRARTVQCLETCKDKRCLVFGSAPGLTMPVSRPDDVVIGANGGAALAYDEGMDIDVLATTSHLFRRSRSDQEQATIDSLRGLNIGVMYVDEKSGVADVSSMGFTWQSLVPVSPENRSLVVQTATGKDLWVSTGVWSACLATYSGARKVVVAGISLSRGHANTYDDAPRYHVDEDRQALLRLVKRHDVMVSDLLMREILGR